MMTTESSSSDTTKNVEYFQRCNVLIGCTGSVASIKVPVIVQNLLEGKFKVVNFIMINYHRCFRLKRAIFPTIGSLYGKMLQ